MSEGSKEKPANPGQTRPAQPQATWPAPAMPEFQWPHHQMFWPAAATQWQAAAMAAYHHPAAYQQVFLQQAPAAQAVPAAPSPRTKDDSVKVVKPKDPFAVRGIHSPAGIQSPKPNSPGFLLGASKGVGGRAFSVYTSRSDIPGGATPAQSHQIQVPAETGCMATQSPFYDYYIVDERWPAYAGHHANCASLHTISQQGVDLTQKSSRKSSSKSKAGGSATPNAEKDKKDDRPVGVAVARQRSAAEASSTDTSEAVVVSSTTNAATSSAVTTSAATSQAAATTVSNQWSFPSIPYITNPYQHYAIAPQPAMYMMPAHRPMFPPQAGYMVPQQMMIPELTVKTQPQVKAHASTSPNKPVSASTSPKSPLDKAREKLHEINRRKGSSSRQPSPSNSEAKSISSESTEKTADGAETKSYQKSVIMSNPLQPLASPEIVQLKPPPIKKDRKEKQNRTKQNAVSKTTNKSSPKYAPSIINKLTSDKGLKLKSRKSAAMSPSAADAAISSLETLPAKPLMPLIAPAKFKPETKLRDSVEDTSPRTEFPEPLAALKRSQALLAKPKPRRSRSKESLESSNSSWSLPARRASSMSDTSLASPDPPKSATVLEPEKGKVMPRRTTRSDTELTLEVKPAKPVTTGRVRQARPRAQKRKSTESASVTEVSATAALPIPVDVHNKHYIWSENAFDPIIVKHNHQAYDICEEEDLKQLESKLKARLKAVNKLMQTHENYLKGDSSTAFPLLRSLSATSTSESQDCPPSPDKLKSSFSVRSDSHPSLKMKAAAKAKSRASQDEKVTDTPPPPSPPKSPKKAKLMTALAPIAIPEQRLDCRRLTKNELLSTDGLILTCIDGLFYESRIKPISPPDLYGVAIDGERHSSKPRIFTEEELLNHTYTNLTPTLLAQLAVGSRVCAYWSDMISHLYPGKVTDIYPAKNNNSKHLIDIEFDDGDSGKFPLTQIRMLPQDLPHIEYDTSNVIPGGRRRRCVVPETPPIMTTPPNRSRLSRNSITKEPDPSPVPSKKLKKEKSTSKVVETKEHTIFDQSTDDEHVEGEGSLEGSGWCWVGPCTKKPTRGRGVRMEYQSATKDGETISLGNFVEICPPKMAETPYIAEIQNLFSKGNGEMNVTVKWFYHPEELEVKGVSLPKHKGALFRTEHSDTILVESVKQKCVVLSHEVYVKKKLHLRTAAEKKKNNQFYIAGIYDPANKVLSTRYY